MAFSRPLKLFLWIWIAVLVASEATTTESKRKKSFSQVFRAVLQADSVTYTSIAVPEGLEAIQLQLSAAPASFSPKVIVKRDGVPSVESDSALALLVPHQPHTLFLVDRHPVSCMLYLALYGGERLHSRRYFAGSPETAEVDLLVSFFFADPLLLLPPQSQSQSGLLEDGSTLFLNLTANSSVSYPLNLPADPLSSWKTKISLQGGCSDDAEGGGIAPPPGEVASSKLVVRVSRYGEEDVHEQSIPVFCSLGRSEAVLTVPRPLPGQWRLALSWLAGKTSLQQGPSFSPLVIQIQQEREALAVDVLWMDLISSSSAEEGELVYSTPFHTIAAASAVAGEIRSVQYYALSLASPYAVQQAGTGGAMLIVLRHTHRPSNESDVVYRIGFRLGNMPISESLDTVSPEVTVAHGFGGEGGKEEVETVYRWTIHRPVLPGLENPLLSALYLSLSHNGTVKRVEEQQQQEERISLSVYFQSCPVGFCVHGRCMVQRQGTLLAVSLCECDYPYAGEHCDYSTLSQTEYLLEIVSLVVTNFAILPAVLLAATQGLFVIAVGLFSSGFASAFYHLCDTDVYCVLPFSALHVVDVLFSQALIGLVVLLYAPLSPRTFDASCLGLVALLTAPVVADPTNPVTVVVVLVSVLLFVGLSLAIVLYSERYQCLRGVAGIDYSLLQPAPPSPSAKQRGSYMSLPVARSGSDSEERHSSLDLEMVTFTRNASPSLSPEAANLPVDGEGDDDNALLPKQAPSKWSSLNSFFCGIALGLTGLICFALQQKGSYWVLHSVWHLSVMIAAYLLLLGRSAVFSFLSLSCASPSSS
eukprot:gene2711-2961_t